MKSGPSRKEDESRFWFVDFHWPRGFSPLGFHFVTRASWSRRSSPRTSCRSRRPAGSCSAWAGRSSTRARCRSRRRGRSASGPPASRRTCPSSSATSTPSGRSASGSSSSASATSRATTSPASPWPRSASTSPTPCTFQQPRRGRSTSRSCTRCSPSTCSSTGCAPATGSTPATSPRCCRAATPRSWRPTGRCGTWPTRPSASASPTCSSTSPTRSATRCPTAGGNASIWLTKFDDFLKVLRLAHGGHRRHQHPVVDRGPGVAARPDAQLRADGRAPRLRRRRSPPRTAERDEAIEDARSQLSGEALGGFNQLLEICTVANFAWWNEDHNYYIDLRSSIPVRRGALAAARGGRRRPLRRHHVPVLAGAAARSAAASVAWKDMQSIATARHEYYDHYQDLRGHHPEGRRHAAREGRGPGADRDLRHAPATTSTASRPTPHTTNAHRASRVGRRPTPAGPG